MVLYIIAKINFICFNIIMKINFTNIITFGNKTKKFQSGKNSIEEIYTDNDILQKRLITSSRDSKDDIHNELSRTQDIKNDVEDYYKTVFYIFNIFRYKMIIYTIFRELFNKNK